MQTAHLYNFEGASFAFGLFWQPLTSQTGSERTKEIKSLANEMSFDLYMIHNGIMHSVGFAKADSNIRPGVFAGAAIISKTLEVKEKARDFIFVSKLNDGRWVYVAQREGAILPDGDRVLPSEDAARACLLEHMSLGDWPLIVAPAFWGIENSREMSFELDIVPRKKGGKLELHKWWRLLPLDRRRAALSMHSGKIIIAALVAIGLIGGGVYYKKKKAEEEARIAAEIAAQQRDATGAILPPEHPWKTRPLAADMMDACLTALAGQNLFPGNWTVSEVLCADGRLSIAWVPKPGGWIRHLQEIAPNVVVAMDGSSASVGVPLPSLTTGYDEAAPAENERLIEMYATAQQYGVVFSLTPVASAVPAVLPGQDPAAGAPPPDWKEIGWTATNVVFPEAVLSALDGNGFRLNAMKAAWRDGRFVWTMEGTQYVRL